MMNSLQVKVIGNACIIRYNRGEGSIESILDSYNLSQDNAALVKDQIVGTRPDIPWVN
jgi:hypothetical protein